MKQLDQDHRTHLEMSRPESSYGRNGSARHPAAKESPQSRVLGITGGSDKVTLGFRRHLCGVGEVDPCH